MTVTDIKKAIIQFWFDEVTTCIFRIPLILPTYKYYLFKLLYNLSFYVIH